MNGTGIVYDLQHHLLLRRFRNTPFVTRSLGLRGQIKKFSESSGARMRRYLRNCEANYVVMLTLTYPAEYPVDGRVCKRHLHVFLQKIRRYAEMHYGDISAWSAFWFIEFQERGAPHFHLFLTCRYPVEFVSRAWYEVVASGDEKHLRAGTRIEEIHAGRRGICSYASKYAAKTEQKEVPILFENIGRFWGISGLRRTLAATIFIPRELVKSPEFVEFRAMLAIILQKALKEKKLSMMKLSGASAGYYVKDDRVVNEIKLLFTMMGPLLEKQGCLFTYPERDREMDYNMVGS